MRNPSSPGIEHLQTLVGEGEVALQMDEDAFRAFYGTTSRSLWLYLVRVTRDAASADDLMQEAYYRFLRTDRIYDSEEHRRSYLFRIATNLARDSGRRRRVDAVHLANEHEPDTLHAAGDEGERAARRADLDRAMAQLKPRERALLLLAYAQGSTHEEIAQSLGLRKSSIKALLFRARRRFVAMMGARRLRGDAS